MLAYDHPSRATTDVDGELREGVRTLKEFLSGHDIPPNLGQKSVGMVGDSNAARLSRARDSLHQ